jgi:catalase
MAVKFYLEDGTTDVIGLNLPVYFSRTPEDQLAFNTVRRPDPATGQPDLEKVGAYLADHPETVPAVQAALSLAAPASYATVAYNSLHAFGFVDAGGDVRHGRYRLEPAAGESSLAAEEAAGMPPDYLSAELAARLEDGPVTFALDVRLAGPGDPLDDPTAAWPADRELARLGELEITSLAFDRERDGDVLVFDPTRVTDGIELTDDPILLIRSPAYRVSVARRTR